MSVVLPRPESPTTMICAASRGRHRRQLVAGAGDVVRTAAQRHVREEQDPRRALMYFFFQILWGLGRLVPSSCPSCGSSEACCEKRLPMDARLSRSAGRQHNHIGGGGSSGGACHLLQLFAPWAPLQHAPVGAASALGFWSTGLVRPVLGSGSPLSAMTSAAQSKRVCVCTWCPARAPTLFGGRRAWRTREKTKPGTSRAAQRCIPRALRCCFLRASCLPLLKLAREVAPPALEPSLA